MKKENAPQKKSLKKGGDKVIKKKKKKKKKGALLQNPNLEPHGIIGNHGVLRHLKENNPNVDQKENHTKTKGNQEISSIQEKLGEGKKLDSGVKSKMTSFYQNDFDEVRIHTDSNASSLANKYDAKAFTIGKDVAFGANEYKPGTMVGDALIAHELAHVVQQNETRNFIQSDDKRLELEANKATLNIMQKSLGVKNSVFSEITSIFSGRKKTGVFLQRCVKKKLTPEEKVKEVKDTLSAAEKASKVASWALVGEAAEQAEKASKALEGLNKVIKGVDTAIVVYENLKNLQDLSEIDAWDDPEGFAKVAGNTLSSFGKALKKIPPPVGALVGPYGKLLSECGNFFSNMYYKLHPEKKSKQKEKGWDSFSKETPKGFSGKKR